MTIANTEHTQNRGHTEQVNRGLTEQSTANPMVEQVERCGRCGTWVIVTMLCATCHPRFYHPAGSGL